METWKKSIVMKITNPDDPQKQKTSALRTPRCSASSSSAFCETCEVLDQADSALGDKLPAELFDESRSYLISPATKMDPARMKAIEKREDLKPHMLKMETALQHLRGYITALSKDYFNAIPDPEEFRKMQSMYQPELPIVEVLSQTYEAWAETPGAFALWQELCMSWDDDVD